jgi:hypothetical protein
MGNQDQNMEKKSPSLRVLLGGLSWFRTKMVLDKHIFGAFYFYSGIGDGLGL